MMKLRGLLYRFTIVLIIVLVISNIMFAALHFSKQTHAYGEFLVEGEIEVYDADGVTPISGYAFPQFSGGAEHTLHQSFFINNTGTKPVDVYWNISASSILWQLTGSLHEYVYDHYEDSVWKYSLGIRKDVDVSPQYWQPNQEGIVLAVGEGIKLQFELYYTGTPNTAETFALTVSFHANAPTVPGDVNRDGRVDVFDLYALGRAYNSTEGAGNWNPNADLNHDHIIDAEDLRILNDNYGHSG